MKEAKVKVAFLFDNIGPYHAARLSAAGKLFDIVAVQLGARGKSVELFERLGRIGCNEKLYLFGATAWLLILASNMKISHQFSSRYVVVAAPFLLITAIYHFRPSTAAFLRLICGFALSMLLLANYYEWFS